MATNPTFVLPHDPLTPLAPDEEPTPAAVRLLRRELFANARAIPTDLGGGDHGHLGMVMPQVDYIAISTGAVPFTMPPKPAVPNFLGVAAAREMTREVYKDDLEIYHNARGVLTQLKQLILQAIPLTYIAELEDEAMGYANVSPQQILAHMVTNYGRITAKDLETNLQQIKRPWNPDTPIQNVFTNGLQCRQFAAEGNDAISEAAYVRMLVATFRNSGVLSKAIDDWENKPDTDHTLANAIPHFKRADKIRRDNADATKDVLGALQAIDTSDNGKENIQYSYCWTHGRCTNTNHTSSTCFKPNPGHIKEATLTNQQGGCPNIYVPFQGRRDNRRPKPAPVTKAEAKEAAAAAKAAANAAMIGEAVRAALAAFRAEQQNSQDI